MGLGFILRKDFEPNKLMGVGKKAGPQPVGSNNQPRDLARLDGPRIAAYERASGP